MKANSSTLMKMSIAKGLDTTRGSTSTINASAPSQSAPEAHSLRIIASTLRKGRSA